MDKKISIVDIAKHCGVGTSTVSRVLNAKGDTSPQKRKLIEDAIRELGYVPSQSARNMRLGLSADSAQRIIEIPMRQWRHRDSFFHELLDHLIVEAGGMGIRVVVNITPKGIVGEACQGCILLHDFKLSKPEIPQVTVDHFSSVATVPGVLPDYEKGCYAAVKTALSRGFQKPLLACVSPRSDEVNFAGLLFGGFSRALQEEGLDPEQHLHPSAIVSAESGYDFAMKLFKSKKMPDLILVNDDASMGIMRAAHDFGLSIPDDLGIIGCDGINAARYTSPSLATIQIDYVSLAKETLNRLIPAINQSPGPNPHKLKLETQFIDGESIRGNHHE